MSARKRSRLDISNDKSTKLLIGDIIWAKTSKTFPWWPSIIQDPNQLSKELKEKASKLKDQRYAIFYYGVEETQPQYGFALPRQIKPFAEFSDAFSKQKVSKSYEKSFSIALERARSESLLPVNERIKFGNSQSIKSGVVSSKSKYEELIHYALTHGIVYGITSNYELNLTQHAAIHAPFTVQPFKFPRQPFEKAMSLAPVMNFLYEKISRNYMWLVNTLSQTAISDDFTGRLLNILKQVHEEGIKQPLSLGIFRSDYMLHNAKNDSRTFLQVEFNTIASSFGSLSTKISEMHKYFSSPSDASSIPTNTSLASICKALGYSHQQFCLSTNTENAIIIMVVKEGERNFSDQKLLVYELAERHQVRCLRCTLEELQVPGRCTQNSAGLLCLDGVPVSVVYYRVGYSPDDYPTDAHWTTRLMLERSSAIKCPSIGMHLAGSKKVQQALAEPGQLEVFLPQDERGTAAAKELRSVFAGLYSLNVEATDPLERKSREEALRATKQRAMKLPAAYVMKPQREGGGNNLYGAAVSRALRTLDAESLAAFILMERITPPSQGAQLVRNTGSSSADSDIAEEACLCELGVFGVIMSDSSVESSTDWSNAPLLLPTEDTGTRLFNDYAGYLLRVKPAGADEGGVAAGYAVLSSPLLFDAAEQDSEEVNDAGDEDDHSKKKKKPNEQEAVVVEMEEKPVEDALEGVLEEMVVEDAGAAL